MSSPKHNEAHSILSKTTTIHSFRRSVGKSSLCANLAAILALGGKKVGLIDTDFGGASAHLFFGIADTADMPTFNDYIEGKCQILDAAQDVTGRLEQNPDGKLFLVPASTQIGAIMRMLRKSMNLDRYTKGLEKLEKELRLDILLVDTPAGLNENTLMSIAVSGKLVLVLHPDQQDFQGTAVTVDVARRMHIPNIKLVLNDLSENLDTDKMNQQLEETYKCGPAMILTHSEEMLALGSSRPFVLEYPNDRLTDRIKGFAQSL